MNVYYTVVCFRGIGLILRLNLIVTI